MCLTPQSNQASEFFRNGASDTLCIGIPVCPDGVCGVVLDLRPCGHCGATSLLASLPCCTVLGTTCPRASNLAVQTWPFVQTWPAGPPSRAASAANRATRLRARTLTRDLSPGLGGVPGLDPGVCIGFTTNILCLTLLHASPSPTRVSPLPQVEAEKRLLCRTRGSLSGPLLHTAVMPGFIPLHYYPIPHPPPGP